MSVYTNEMHAQARSGRAIMRATLLVIIMLPVHVLLARIFHIVVKVYM